MVAVAVEEAAVLAHAADAIVAEDVDRVVAQEAWPAGQFALHECAHAALAFEIAGAGNGAIARL